MTFIWPALLLLLGLVPVFIVVYINLQRRRKQISANYGQFSSVAGRMGRGPGIRRHIPPAIFLVSFAILMIALARPQTVVNLPKIEGTVILAFDVSGSMAADDLKPNRMEAAKVAAQDFVQRQPPSVQIGVVAFSDSGFSVQVPTNKQELILAAINRLTPQRGTSLARGIQASLNTINSETGQPELLLSNITPTSIPTRTPFPKGMYTPAVIVMITDGENNESPDPLAAAQTAADQGVRIYTVGVGSPAGTTLHINGISVHTQLFEKPLQQIAQLTGGTYYNALTEQNLRSIYDNLDPELVIRPEKTEDTSIFTGVSILLLLVGCTFSMVWFSRLL